MAAALSKLPGDQRYRTVARLVCDQVLHIELADGSFVGGVLADRVLFGDGVPSRRNDSSAELDHLSKSAIDHAIATPTESSIALSRRLYSFNSTPRSNRWDKMLRVDGCVPVWLGLNPRSSWLDRLTKQYGEYGSLSGETPWIQWIRKDIDPQECLRYKIYVSPPSDQLPHVLHVVCDVCRSMDVPAFKVGATLVGVLRSDKLVIYVKDQAAVGRVAEELHSALAGIKSHGVPFTAAVYPKAPLFWAIDPTDEPILGLVEYSSTWRTLIVERLATAIAHAKAIADHARTIDFALQRLRLEGIEPIGWCRREFWI